MGVSLPVSIVTRLRSDNRRTVARDFSVLRINQIGSAEHPVSGSVGTGASFPMAGLPRLEAYHSLSSREEGKHAWNYTS
jgi:hypothetical protein